MNKTIWIVCAVLLFGLKSVHASVLRDPINSRWTDQPVEIDGRATEWSDNPVLQEEGFSFRAMNDASTLYLLIAGETRDEEMVLSGKYRQEITFWFVKPDESSRSVGLNLNFSHLHPPASSTDTIHRPSITLASIGVVPEWTNAEGQALSSATLPSGMELQANLFHQNGEKSLYEIKIPLNLLERQGNSVLVDFVTSQVSPDVAAHLQSGRSEQRSSDGGGESSEGGGGGGHHHRGGGSKGGGRSASVEVPNPVDLHLVIALTPESKH